MQHENVILVDENASVPKIIRKIKDLTLQASTHPEIKQVAADALKSNNVLKYIFDYSYDRILYVPNKQGTQELRTVWNFLREGKGNCAIYVEMIGAVLLNLGIPYKYRVVNYVKKNPITGKIEYPKEMQHVYIVVRNGREEIILDPVIGQRQDGTDTRSNRPLNGQFNTELKFYKKIDYPMARLEVLQGTIGATENFKHIVTNRSKMARYGMLNGAYGTCGCGCSDELGKTIIGRFLKKAADIGKDIVHVAANVVVSPIEAATGKQIVGPNYETKVGAAVDKATASVVEKVGEAAIKVFSAGTVNVDLKNPYDVSAQLKAQQEAAQAEFDLLNNQDTGSTQFGGGTVAMILLGSVALGTMMFSDKKKKGKTKKKR